jgi:hypothetical protein
MLQDTEIGADVPDFCGAGPLSLINYSCSGETDTIADVEDGECDLCPVNDLAGELAVCVRPVPLTPLSSEEEAVGTKAKGEACSGDSECRDSVCGRRENNVESPFVCCMSGAKSSTCADEGCLEDVCLEQAMQGFRLSNWGV